MTREVIPPRQKESSHMRKNAWRAVAAGALALGTAAAMVGCSTTGTDDGTKTLSILWESGGQAGLEAVIAEFEKANPDVEVRAEFLATDPYFTQIRTRLSAGNAADVLFVWPGNGNVSALEVLAPNGYLADLSDMDWVQELPEALLQYADYDGKYYAFLTQITGFGQMINDQALAEAGLEIPTTWDEVLQFCADARSAGKVAYSMGTATLHESQFVSYALTPQTVYANDPDFDAKLDAGETTFADSGWKEALELHLDMVDAGCFNDGFSGADMDEAIRLWSVGDAIGLVGIGQYVLYSQNPEATFTMAPLPASNNADESWMAVAGWGGAAVNAKAKDIELAKEFVAFLASPEMNALYNENSGGGKGMMASISSGDTAGDQFAEVYTEYLELGRTAVFPDQKWPNPEVQRALQAGMQEALQGRKSVDDVLADMQAAFDQGGLK